MRLLKILVTVLTIVFAVPAHAEIIHDKAYQSVISSGKIRCGYSEWAPFLIIDANTGKTTGIMKDVMDEIGKRMGLKVEWAASIGWGEITSAANSGKIDMFCNTTWPDKAQLQNMSISRPLFYTPTYAYVRQGDTRFDNNYEAINSPSVTIAGIDGDSSYTTMQDHFPKAKMLALPNTADISQQIMNITTKKADIMLADPSAIGDYNQKADADKKLVQVKGKPLFVMSEILVTRAGEQQLMNAINTVLYSLINEGFLDKTLKKYGATSSFAPQPEVKLPELH
jgi:ABC-type amino acid transport substrate-binding protein